MTRARQVLPDETALITRRCAERRYFLKPSKKLNKIVRYLLAVASMKYGVDLVAGCFMANHYHLVAADPDAVHPRFTGWFNAMMARVVNAYRERREALWSSEQVNVCVLPTATDVMDRAAYVLNNPVAAGIVERGADWPGVRSSPHAAAHGAVVVKRPNISFFKKSRLPEQAELRFVVPREYGHMTAQEFGDALALAVSEREAAVHEEMRAANRRFAGAESVKRLVWHERPAAEEERDRGRGFFPRVATRCKETRRAVLDRIAGFEQAYRRARLAFRDGHRRVLFPFGTYQLLHTVGVRCHPPP